MNKVILIGNIVRDPEVRFLNSGSQVASTSLVTNRRYKDKAGNKVDEPSFHSLSVFGPLAATFGEYVKKGNKLVIEGSLRYQDVEKDGVKTRYTSILVDKFDFLSGPAERSENEAPRAQARPQAKQAPKPSVNDEDIPW